MSFDSAEKQLHSVRKDFVDRVSKSVVDDLLDGLLQQKVINNHEMETVKVIPERAEKAREVIDMVLRKGAVSCLIMKTLLVELDPFLCTTLVLKWSFSQTLQNRHLKLTIQETQVVLLGFYRQ
uniref:CARD domain-containing protein n=1 Tax=Salmo trutta TaxID=8032 RepID=A0A674EWV2_SALTR